MSSLKHIQDLEERLTVAKQEIIQLRMTLSQKHSDRSHSGGLSHNTLTFGGQDNQSESRSTAAAQDNVTPIMAVSWRQATTCIYVEEIPPEPLTTRLLSIWDTILSVQLPIVPLADYKRETEKLYEHGKLDRVPQAWRGVLFAIIACAMQSSGKDTQDYSSEQYIQLAISALDQTWSQPVSLDHVRLALLVSSYFFEANMQLASVLWYESACGLARRLQESAVMKPSQQQALRLSLRWIECVVSSAHSYFANVFSQAQLCVA